MSAVLVTGATLITQNSPLSPLAVAVAIASTHYAYPQRDGQAELAWVAGLNTEIVYPRKVTHPSTTRAHVEQIEINALPLSQTATIKPLSQDFINAFPFGYIFIHRRTKFKALIRALYTAAKCTA